MNIDYKVKNIYLFGSDSDSTRILYNSLSIYFSISKVVIEKDETKFKFFSRRIKKIGFFRVIDQLLFIVTYSKILRSLSKKRIKEILERDNLFLDSIPHNKVTKVLSINSKEVIDLIKNDKPEIIILSGTRILSKKVILTSQAKIINIHAGITPNYRGVHGAYWALVNKEIHLTGVTVHYVDVGVDTGQIIDQELINISDGDNYATYPLLQLSLGIQLLIKFLIADSYKMNYKSNILGSNISSKQWYHPGLFEYLFNRIFRGVK